MHIPTPVQVAISLEKITTITELTYELIQQLGAGVSNTIWVQTLYKTLFKKL